MPGRDLGLKLLTGAAIVLSLGAINPLWAQGTAAPAAPAVGRTKLPEEALKMAQQAEKHLKQDQADKAIGILEQVDKNYPGYRAVSLRLAQIYDTAGKNGEALFYYRRYAELGGGAMLEDVQPRVMALELMPGVALKAEQFSKSRGEATRELATPTPVIERTLNAALSDGALLKIDDAEDLDKIVKEGLPKTTPAPSVKAQATPIVIHRPTPRATTTPAVAALDPGGTVEPQPVLSTAAPTTAGSNTYPAGTPASTDEDAMLARSFRSSGQTVEEVVTPAPATEVTPKLALPRAQQRPEISSAPGQLPQAAAPALPPARSDEAVIAYTSKTPTSDSPRAHSFFNVKETGGGKATVVAINSLPDAVVTMSIVPKDEREPSQAILLPGETRTFSINPETYDVTVNVATNDYPPITQMNTSFAFKFSPGRQYTRRFTPGSLQVLN